MDDIDLAALDEVQRRVLWLATRIVDSANHDRESVDGVKVGGHQASSASLVTAMTVLYFAHLGPNDKVSVKPHASPVFHAIQYLLGNLDRSYLPRLRDFKGLQAYPSRTKDPDRARIDFSTGSVGLGPAAPLFAAAVRRYVDARFGSRPRSRFIALLGDAELDEGNIWEAIADPATAGLGDVTWVVDLNRQSLDRVVPGIRIAALTQQFAASGWHVVEVKYGRRLTRAFAELPHGEELRLWIDAMPNEQYQSLFGTADAELRKRFLDGAPEAVATCLAGVAEAELRPLITDLGGHDLSAMLDAYRQADADPDRPTVIFAYTVKGWGLPIAGDPRNHSALLSAPQIDDMRARTGLTRDTEWDRPQPSTPAGALCAARAAALARPERDPVLATQVPTQTMTRSPRGPVSSQESFGRIMVDLARDPAVAPYLVTTSPDVAVSTNLAGWINKVGVFSPTESRDWASPEAALKWRPSPSGQHLELGISEMNLFLLLGQLGLSWDLSGQPLLPVGTVYDPFVCRGLDAFIYATYSGARFVLAGTPSGVTLAPEGGAHQSAITASIGLELPGVVFAEPAYAQCLDWLLCDGLARIAAAQDGASLYLRLSTRPIDQAPFEAVRAARGDEALRADVLRGAYRLREGSVDGPVVHLAGSGAVIPGVLAAAEELESEGIRAHVVDITCADRLYTDWRRTMQSGVRRASPPPRAFLRDVFAEPGPVVTVQDAASHAMAWLGSALGVPAVPLGVDAFGQSGTVDQLHAEHDLDPGSIVNAALVGLDLFSRPGR